MRLSRRNALRAAAFGVGAVGLRYPVRADPTASFPGDIDAHSHVWSNDLERYPLGPWAKPADMQPPSFTAEEFLAIAHANGVDRAVLIQHAPLHSYDNAYILDCAKAHPGVFSVVAMIDERLPRVGERLADLTRQGARGIRIGPTNHADRTPNADPPMWLDAPGMVALWEHAARLGVAICPLVAADFLGTLDPMCEKHPETVCVIDHFGHVDPEKPDTVAALVRLARHQNVYVKVSGFYKFGDRKPPYDDLVPMIRSVIDAFGPQRLMWGSDCPYQLNDGNTYADAIGLMRRSLDELSENDRRGILRDTAARVFF
jgi:predicted TIM-barrel fold metal-dependent hydrolase